MSRERVIDFLPEIYRPFLPEVFERPMAEERHATCANCTMCPPPEPVLPPEAYFNPSTKCCTFHPALPNYSVGGLLRDTTGGGAEGRRRILGKIEARIGVTPAGILPPARVLLLQRHGKQGFGRAERLVCPYLDRDRGACTVWAHREAECATWFCKHNHGFDGRAFWKHLRDYLVTVHVTLGTWVMRELGIDPDRIAAGFGPRLDALDARDLDDGPPPDAAYAAMWGPWHGREVDFYEMAFDMVRTLDRARFAALVGIDHTVAIDHLAKRHDAITHPRLPDPLTRNPALRVDRAPDGSYVLTAGDVGESTRLRGEVYRLLDLFDGRRPTDAVKARVKAETGFGVSDSFLTALYHHRILIGA
jgi:hypothetical protein